MRPLTDEERAALKTSIQKRGVLVPIDVDEAGEILDGHHRFDICQELGTKNIQYLVRPGLTEQEKRAHILTLNVDRRHLTKAEQKEIAARIAALNPEKSDRQIAEETGLSDHTVASVRAKGESTAQIAQLDRRVGKDGKSRPARRSHTPTVFAASPAEATRAQRAVSEMPVEKLPQKTITTNRVVRLAREHQAATRAEAVTGDIVAGDMTLLLGEMQSRGAEVVDGSVDLIFTDPPYGQDSLSLWTDLAVFAVRTLKPNGMLVAYSGATHLPEVMRRLGEHLHYWWIGAVVLPGAHAAVQARHVWAGSKPLLFYVRDGFCPTQEWVEDTYHSEARQKEDHDWQQSLGCAKHYVAHLCPVGGLVGDPFLGAGTTGVAAVGQGRHFLGIEYDAKAMAAARARIASVGGVDG